MPSLHEIYPEMRDALARSLKASPPPSARPDGLDFGTILAALLSRSSSDQKAGEVVEALRASGLETPEDLAQADLSELTEATRGLRGSSQPISPKSMKPLQLLSRWIVARGGLDAIAEAATEDLRDDLRAIPGIGPAATDALLLHGMNRAGLPRRSRDLSHPRTSRLDRPDDRLRRSSRDGRSPRIRRCPRPCGARERPWRGRQAVLPGHGAAMRKVPARTLLARVGTVRLRIRSVVKSVLADVDHRLGLGVEQGSGDDPGQINPMVAALDMTYDLDV